jgi:Icc-related predicted phosphoesterase
MRLVAISDTHFNMSEEQIKELIPDGDVLVHAGDLMYEGTPMEWKERLDFLGSLPHKIKIYVPGNHDYHPAVYTGPAVENLLHRGIKPLFGAKYTTTLPNGMKILGLPFVTNLVGWAFNSSEHLLEEFLFNKYYHNHVDIIVSHSPPHGILDKLNDGKNTSVGIHAYTDFFHKKVIKPKHWICGHIHESYGTAEMDGCKFYNVAMCNEDYLQTNKGMVIDI